MSFKFYKIPPKSIYTIGRMNQSALESSLLSHAEKFVEGYINQRLPRERYFHGIRHTREVVEKCESFFARAYNCSLEQTIVLTLAAWFHDVGYCDSAIAHEEVGVSIMIDSLRRYDLQKNVVSAIEELILAKRIHHKPSTLLEKCIKDADLSHLGSPQYQEWSQLLKLEMEYYEEKKYSDSEWTKINIEFMESHQFYTDYAQEHWQDQKEINLRELRQSVTNNKG